MLLTKNEKKDRSRKREQFFVCRKNLPLHSKPFDGNPPAAQNVSPTTVNEEIQLSNLESNGNNGSVETMNTGNYSLEEETEKIISDSETQQSDIQSESNEVPAVNWDPAEQKRKENPEEEEGKSEKEGALHPLWTLCSYFRRNFGSFSPGDNCRYAHGEGELHSWPHISWDPTSQRGKKLLKSKNGERIEVSHVGPWEDVLPSVDVSDDSSSDGALHKCLVHLPPKWTWENLKSFPDGREIIYEMAKKKKGMAVGFVNCATDEQVKKASEEMNVKSFGNKHIKIANVLPRSYEKKPKAVTLDQGTFLATEDSRVEEDPASDVCPVTVENDDTVEKDNYEQDGLVSKTRSARDVVTPLAHMAYSDQLEHKKNSLLQTLRRLDYKGISNAAPADSPLFPLPIPTSEGVYSPEDSNVTEERIHDYISNLCFCILPTAFFKLTLLLHSCTSLAGDWAGLGPNTLLFDIYCGIGAIGLTLAHRFGGGCDECSTYRVSRCADQSHESLHIPERKCGGNLRDGENATKNDMIHNLGAASNPDALENCNGAKTKSECPDDTCRGSLEFAHVVMERVELADHTEVSTINASFLNEAESEHADHDHEVSDAKSMSNNQQSETPSQQTF